MDALLQRARELDCMGEDEPAKSAYIEYLQHSPDDVEALIDIGNLALRTGSRRAACTAYRRAIELDPYNLPAYVNLGNALLQGDDLPAARCEYEAALRIAPAFPPAHQGLSYVFARMGDEPASRKHRDLGFGPNPLMHVPYRGAGKPLRALVFVSAAGGDFNTEFLLDQHRYDVTKVFSEYAGSVALPAFDFIVNAVADAERCEEALRTAARLTSHRPHAVVNAPERVLQTGRIAVAERLRQIPNVITPQMALFSRDELSRGDGALRARGFTYPLLLRTPGHHTGRHFIKVDRSDDLSAAVASLPGDALLAIEFLDVRGADGFVRKYRVIAIGGGIFPVHAAVSRDWKVHYFTSDSALSAEHRAEDARFLEAPGAVLPHSASGALEAIVSALHLDYVGIDFTLDANGRVVVFEANAATSVYRPDADARWSYRRAATDRIGRAFERLCMRRRLSFIRESCVRFE